MRKISVLLTQVVFVCLLLSSPVTAAPVGQAAPSFTLFDEDSNSVSLQDFHGQGVILDFCSVWCVPCQAFYSDFYPVLPGNNLILSVLMQSADATPSELADAQVWDATFPINTVLHTNNSQATHDTLINDYLADLGVAFPTFVFVDKNLNVVANIVGLPNLLDLTPWNQAFAAIEASQVVPLPASFWMILSRIGFIAGTPRIVRRKSR